MCKGIIGNLRVKHPTLTQSLHPGIPGPQLLYLPHPEHSLCIPHPWFQWVGNNACVGHHQRFEGGVLHPSLNLFILAFQDPNYCITLTQHTPSASPVLGFNGQGITLAWGRHWRFEGGVPHPPLDLFILASQDPNYCISLTQNTPSMFPSLVLMGRQ